MDEMQRRLELTADALSIGRLERHVLLCAEQTDPQCSTWDESHATWTHLKRLTREHGLASSPPSWRDDPHAEAVPEPGAGRVLRSKVDCFRVCQDGPIAVVYPDGIWYRGVTPEVMERIVVEHVIGGVPVEEFVFARDDLAGPDRT